MKNKKVVVLLITSLSIILLLGFFVSKYIYFNVQEDIYYSSNMTNYESIVDYIKEKPKLRDLHNDYDRESIESSLLNIKFRLPFDKMNDSIELKYKDKALIGGIINENLKKTKSILFVINHNKVVNNIKKEVIDIDNKVDTLDIFNMYDYVYSHTPKTNIFLDSYDEIKYNLRLSHLKSIITVNGGDKNIYKYINSRFKAFQFCKPGICRTNYVSLYINNLDVLMTFKNFTQDEIDFVLNSIEWEPAGTNR